MGYFVNFNFMAQTIHNLSSFQTCSNIYKVDYHQNVVQQVKYELSNQFGGDLSVSVAVSVTVWGRPAEYWVLDKIPPKVYFGGKPWLDGGVRG